ncbi:MAG: hypothetical protein LBB07_03185 [Bifidobacteriaceae bacterium]|jgi:hypothetical protein|nr:hypothetical protein [Bifidobacteriaceae bacterium]
MFKNIIRIKYFTYAVVICILSALAFTGCSTSSNNSSGEPAIGDIQKITSSSQISRPIDKYTATPEEILSANHVLDSKIRSCFAENGIETSIYSYALAQYKDDVDALSNFQDDLSSSLLRSNQLYGFFDTSDVSKYGYSGPLTNVRKVSFKEDSSIPENSPVIKKCIDDNINNMTIKDADFHSFLYPNSQWPDGGPKVPTADSRVIAAQNNWSKCMKEKGFDFESVNSPSSKFSQPRKVPTPEELATASADIQCKIDTNLVGIDLAVQSAYDNEYIDAHRDQLEAWKQSLLDYIAGK